MMNNFFQGQRLDVFKRPYRVYTGAFCGKPHIDEGGKIILPTSALDELARLNIVYPMLFKISNAKKKKATHCGVLEFSAEEGRAYIPFWMQEYLQLSPGALVNVESVALPKGTFVKIRPQQKAFIEISDPKAVLEKQLRNFSCLSRGDTIIIAYNNKQFFIDIVAVASASGDCEAVSIVETDVKVEFERPADMPPSPVNPVTPSADELFKVNNNIIKQPNTTTATPTTNVPPPKEEPKEPPKFVGVGRRLDGKGGSSSNTPTSTTPTKATTTPTTTATPSAASGASGTNLNTSGLVLGRKRKTYGEEDKKPGQPGASTSAPTTTTEKKDENKFKAFAGQGRSLK